MTERSVVGANRDDVDLIEVARRLLAQGWLISGLSALGLLASVLYLHLAEPKYRTELLIAPAASSGGGANRLGGLGGLAAIAGVTLGSASQGVTPFDLYIETLQSRALAASLAEDPIIMHTAFKAEWDAEADRWREPRSWRRSSGRWLASILGIQQTEWHAPGAAELQEFIRHNLVVERPDVKDAPITRLVLDHHDPKFAAYLLGRASQVADGWVRRNNLVTARSYAAYLSEKLRTEQVAEYRRHLSDALGEQEKSIMMASSSAPYAATVIEPPTTGLRSVRPNGLLVLLSGAIGGAMIGCVLALVNFRSMWRRLR